MFTKLVSSRRSISQFKDKKISREIIDELITTATNTPSSCNTQPWYYVVFDTKNSKKELTQLIDKGYEYSQEDILNKYKLLGNIYVKLLKFFSNYGKFDGAPVYILLFARPYDTPLFSQALKFSKYDKILTIAQDSVKTSTSMSMQNFLLAAHEKGLGTRVKDGIKFLMNFEDLKKEMYEKFNIDDEYLLISGIQLGYPTEESLKRIPPKKLPLEKIRKYI